jgi:hypothetical protein
LREATEKALKLPPFSLGRKDGNGSHRAAVLAAVILHAEFHIGNEGHLLPALISILDDVRGTNTGAHSLASVSSDALFPIENKLNITHRIIPHYLAGC